MSLRNELTHRLMMGATKRTTSRSKNLTCDAVEREEGENALAPLTASTNTRAVLENIIVVYSCV